ncbi:hypothetical protein CRI94_05190 [Longibacter salinarum]|uniref:Uncharacterized protein n=1 Tax=Longibacter salinarum TaxID=1850348 RepID=A0A2A8D0K8_9BACT|nr:hypothetical protein [Longibacter salinarum]PEN14424.1 hypothetical protein CRI94_05190 [Longibacter salinarum]
MTLLFILFAVAGVGCRSTGPLTVSAPMLADVNDAMAGETVRLYKSGTQTYRKVSQVTLSADSMYFVDGPQYMRGGHDRPMEQIAIGRVDSLRIKYAGGGGVVGGLVGTVPGAFLALDAAAAGRECETIYCGISTAMGQAIGIGLAVIGLGVGAIIGNAVDDDVQTVYRWPVEDYLE